MNYYKNLKKLNEAILLEYDRKDLRKWAGDDLTQRFFAIRNKAQAPENDLGYWIKKGDLDEFEKFVSNWETGAVKSKTQQKKDERIAGADLILNEKGWKVYHVTTYEAAKQLGSNTTWCITGRYRGYENKGKHYFDSYIRDYHLDGGYYFIFDTLNKDHNDVAKYCAGVDWKGNLKFLYNGMQDREISRKGIPNISPERRIKLLPMVDILFYDPIKVDENGVLQSIDYDNFPSSDPIVLPEGVVEIPKKFFVDVFRPEIKLPSTLRKIGKIAFGDSGINTLTIGENISDVDLGNGFCFGCGRLKSVGIYGGVSKIPSKAFSYCENLNNIEINPSVELIEIADDAFINSEFVTIYSDIPMVLDYCKAHEIQCCSLSSGEVLYSPLIK